MKKFLSCVLFPTLAFCLISYSSYTMEDPPQEEQSSIDRRLRNEEAVKGYFGSEVNPKIALYGEGDNHTRESNYSLFITVDSNFQTCPKIHADITNLEDMAVIPSGQLDCVELRNIPSIVFSKNPESTFKDIARVLKKGGILKFNDMWGRQDASALKSRFLKTNGPLKESNPEVYTQLEEAPTRLHPHLEKL